MLVNAGIRYQHKWCRNNLLGKPWNCLIQLLYDAPLANFSLNSRLNIQHIDKVHLSHNPCEHSSNSSSGIPLLTLDRSLTKSLPSQICTNMDQAFTGPSKYASRTFSLVSCSKPQVQDLYWSSSALSPKILFPSFRISIMRSLPNYKCRWLHWAACSAAPPVRHTACPPPLLAADCKTLAPGSHPQQIADVKALLLPLLLWHAPSALILLSASEKLPYMTTEKLPYMTTWMPLQIVWNMWVLSWHPHFVLHMHRHCSKPLESIDPQIIPHPCLLHNVDCSSLLPLLHAPTIRELWLHSISLCTKICVDMEGNCYSCQIRHCMLTLDSSWWETLDHLSSSILIGCLDWCSA